MFDVDEVIKVWHDSVVQFGRELEDFLNHLPPQRARFWGIDLWLWLQDQRDRGFKVDGDSYARLRKALDELRDDLIDQGVELQQVYTPSPAQQARERAAIRARNDRSPTSRFSAPAVEFIPPRARMAPDDAGQASLSPTDDEVRYWVERLRGLIQSIMQNYPAERWVEIAAAAMKRIGVPQQIADRILEWVQAESDRYLFFKRIVDEALGRSAAENVPTKRSPADDLVDLAVELAKGLKELSADGKPERLFKALQTLIDHFPEFVPESLRSKDLDELLADIQQTMQALLDFLKVLPPEAYAVIPDLLQGMLDILGLIPVVGEVADVISGVLSYYRGEILAVALTVASLIPVLGAIPGVAKILVRLNRILKLVRKMSKRAVREALEKLLKFLMDELGGINLSFEWLQKFLERLRKLLRELLEKLKKGDGPGGPKTPRPGSIAGRGMWKRVNEAMPPRARAYQAQITGHTGEAHVVETVKFDGFTDGVLLEAKGPGYAKFVANGKFTRWFKYKDQIVKQATDQARVARGDPVTWHIADKEAVPAFKDLVNRAGAGEKINVVHTPAVLK